MTATLRLRPAGSAGAAALAAGALLTVALLTVAPATAHADNGGGPSAGQVAASKARVARLEREHRPDVGALLAPAGVDGAG